MNFNIYECRDGRVRVYDKETKHVMSYPKFLMEQVLDKKLSDNEQVHHIDQNPLNNDLSNLEIRTLGEHQREHNPPKYHDIKRKCDYCGEEFIWTAKQQKTFYSNQSRKGTKRSGKVFCSKRCSGCYGKEMQLLNAGVSERNRKQT